MNQPYADGLHNVGSVALGSTDPPSDVFLFRDCSVTSCLACAVPQFFSACRSQHHEKSRWFRCGFPWRNWLSKWGFNHECWYNGEIVGDRSDPSVLKLSQSKWTKERLEGGKNMNMGCSIAMHCHVSLPECTSCIHYTMVRGAPTDRVETRPPQSREIDENHAALNQRHHGTNL